MKSTHHRNVLNFFCYTLLAIVLVLGTSCSLPKVKEPKFKTDFKDIETELKALKNFEKVGLQWSATSSKDGTFNVLTLTLVNGRAVPENIEELTELGKTAAVIVKNSIDNIQDYSFINVAFQTSSGVILTQSKSIALRYSIEEL
ncbi:MAG TPA: hypothetical protein VEC36_04090 [Patescibacteria group bacterium]|nr:hypothetical protein [Patescibacteria group bacterium]